MPLELGVNTTLSGNQRNIDDDLDLAHALGFRWVRTSQEMHWGGSPAYSLDVLARYAQACKDRGIRLIQCAQGMPAPLARGGRAGHYGAKSAAAASQWGAWFGECCARVQEAAGITSCLNEPDNFGWDTTPSAADCALLHVAAFEGRDRRAPDAIVSTGEMAPGASPEPLAFLKAILAATAGHDLLDEQRVVVGWHPYIDPRWTADFDAIWNACHRMRDVHAFLVADGHPRMKIMGGEWGIANGPAGNVRALTPAKVADYVRLDYLPAFVKQRADGVRLGPQVWYALRDFPPPSDRRLDSWANYCGLVDVRGNPKPVAGVLEAFNRGG